MLVVQDRRVRRRIPITVIERVDVRGRRGRVLAVVLLREEGTELAATELVQCRSAPAVDAMAAALRTELSVRDAVERRSGGTSQVTVEELDRPRRRKTPRLRTVAIVLYLLVLAWLVAVVVFEPGLRTATSAGFALLYWVLSPGLAGLSYAVAPAVWEMTEGPWRLRARGITVTGQLIRTYHSGGVNYVYAFTDTHGEERTCDSPDGGLSQVEIVYDPDQPSFSEVRSAIRGNLIFGLVLFLILVVPLTVGTVVLGFLGLDELAELVATVGLRPPIG